MENSENTQTSRNQELSKLIKVSNETGVTVEMVNQILQSIVKKRKNVNHIDCKAAIRFLVSDLMNNGGSVKDVLVHNKINSSKDVGVVVKALCEERLLIKEEQDNYDDFDNLFISENIEEYLKKEKLKKDIDWYKTGSYILYSIGFIAVVGSYTSYVPTDIGWSGWMLGMLGWALISFRNRIEPIFKISK